MSIILSLYLAITLSSNGFSQEMIKAYCRAQNVNFCAESGSYKVCQLLMSQCIASWKLVQEEEIKSLKSNKTPDVVTAQLVFPKMCAADECRGLNAQNKNCNLNTGFESNLYYKKVNDVHFSFQSIYRVQTGTSTNVIVNDLNLNNVNAPIKNFMNNKGYTLDQALKADDLEFEKFLSISKEKYEVMNAVRRIMGLSLSQSTEYLSKISGSLSFNQKAEILATVLGNWSEGYDIDRANSSKGLVNYEQLMKTSRDRLLGKEKFAGVCRDMHQEASKLAKAMGIDHAYGIGFQNKKSAHRTLVISDPNDRTKIYKLNYGEITQSAGCTGPNCLEQVGEMPSNGLVLRGWSSQDEILFQLPTVVGATLHKATGGSSNDLYPLYEFQGSFTETKLKLGALNTNFFYSQNPEVNRSVIGAGVSVDNTALGPITFSGGIAGYKAQIGQLNNTTGLYGRTKVDLTTYHGENKYGYIEPYVALSGLGTVYDSQGLDVNGLNKEFRVQIQNGVRGRSKNLSGEIGLSSALNKSSDGKDSKFSPTITRPVLYYKFNNKFKVSKNFDGSFKVIGSVISLDTGFHPIVKTEVSVSSEKLNVTLAAGRSIRSDTPLYFPGAGAQGSASVDIKIVDGVFIGGTVGVSECSVAGACFFSNGMITIAH